MTFSYTAYGFVLYKWTVLRISQIDSITFAHMQHLQQTGACVVCHEGLDGKAESPTIRYIHMFAYDMYIRAYGEGGRGEGRQEGRAGGRGGQIEGGDGGRYSQVIGGNESMVERGMAASRQIPSGFSTCQEILAVVFERTLALPGGIMTVVHTSPARQSYC